MILGRFSDNENMVYLNTILLLFKWEWWKIRNKFKYNRTRYCTRDILKLLQNNVKNHLIVALKASNLKYVNRQILETLLSVL